MEIFNIQVIATDTNKDLGNVGAKTGLLLGDQVFSKIDSDGLLVGNGFKVAARDSDSTGTLTSGDVPVVSKQFSVDGRTFHLISDVDNSRVTPQFVNFRLLEVYANGETYDVTVSSAVEDVLGQRGQQGVNATELVSIVEKCQARVGNIPVLQKPVSSGVKLTGYTVFDNSITAVDADDHADEKVWGLWHSKEMGALADKGHLDLDNSIDVINPDGNTTKLHEWDGGRKVYLGEGRTIQGTYDIKGRSEHTVVVPANDGTRDLLVLVNRIPYQGAKSKQWVPTGERLIYVAPESLSVNPLQGKFVSSDSDEGKKLTPSTLQKVVAPFEGSFRTIRPLSNIFSEPSVDMKRIAAQLFGSGAGFAGLDMAWLTSISAQDFVSMVLDEKAPEHFTNDEKQSFAENKPAFLGRVQTVIGQASFDELSQLQNRLGQALQWTGYMASIAVPASAVTGVIDYSRLSGSTGHQPSAGFDLARNRLDKLISIQRSVIARTDNMDLSAEQKAVVIGNWVSGFTGKPPDAKDVAMVVENIARGFMPQAGEGWASATSLGMEAMRFLESVVSSATTLFGQVGGWLESMAQQALVKAFSMADVMYDARIAMFQHFSTALPNATDRNYFQNKINEIFSEKRSHEDALMRMLDMLHEAMRAACNAN